MLKDVSVEGVVECRKREDQLEGRDGGNSNERSNELWALESRLI